MPEQKEDAKRLKAIWLAKKAELGLTQQTFGSRYDIGDQGLVTQYLNGIIPLNLKAAIRFAKGLKVGVSDFSPSLGEIVAMVSDLDDYKDMLRFWQQYKSKNEGIRHIIDAALWGKP